MSRVALTVLCWLLLIFKETQTADVGCTFAQNLIVGNTYYVYNNEYPYQYEGQHNCAWTLKSDYRVNLHCTTFELPWTVNCIGDILTVQTNSTTSHKYCGNGAFNITSTDPTMVVKLSTSVFSTGGRFLCEARALERPQDSQDCRCGWKNPTRIVGGVEAGVNEFPMMAGLIDVTILGVWCGGTIISNRYVLSAAHCVYNRNTSDFGVLVGDHDISIGNDTNAAVLHKVIQFLIHPDYRSRGNFNDMALVKTETQIVFNNRVGPACLPFQHQPDTFGGNFVEALGWGSREFGQGPSDTLQKVTLSIWTNLECSKVYPNVTRASLCTYGKGKDACQFDSGGPVLWQNPTTKRLVLVAVISAGTDCGVTAGLNTRVGAYLDWIVSATSDSSYCISE
ncbi:venom serine protease 34-like isoform X1 [Megachile rotundata]|uniref:venom serine protease 34-like isoform X1 n=1 Tax=Megachile rotundata TaxID=143995 RepID=UPI003FD53B70